MLRYCSLLIILWLIAFSCTQRHNDLLPVNEIIPTASITFLAPTPEATFSKGDSITLKAQAISTAEIHGFDLIIRDISNGNNLSYTHIHDHNDTLNINEKWKSELTSPSNLEAEVVIYLDHALHTKKEKVAFHLK